MTERRWVFSEDKKVALNGYFGDTGSSTEPMPAVVVLPGGGYIGIAEPEGAPVARWFAQNGFHAFVMEYSTAYGEFGRTEGEMNPNALFPGPAYDLASALVMIRENAKEWNIDENRIALCGFSAGGHLAAYFGNNWIELAKDCEVPARMLKPNADILCYAATDMTRDASSFMEKQMYTAIFGTDSPSEDERKALTPRYNVNVNTPPTFMWHSAADTAVPAVDSMTFAAALANERIHYALHIFDKGAHADALSEGLPAQIWPQLAVRFLNRYMR